MHTRRGRVGHTAGSIYFCCVLFCTTHPSGVPDLIELRVDGPKGVIIMVPGDSTPPLYHENGRLFPLFIIQHNDILFLHELREEVNENILLYHAHHHHHHQRYSLSEEGLCSMKLPASSLVSYIEIYINMCTVCCCCYRCSTDVMDGAWMDVDATDGLWGCCYIIRYHYLP